MHVRRPAKVLPNRTATSFLSDRKILMKKVHFQYAWGEIIREQYELRKQVIG